MKNDHRHVDSEVSSRDNRNENDEPSQLASSSTDVDDVELNLKKKIKEVYRLFDMKKTVKKLTLEEKNAKAEIEIRRAEYQLDQFVKINDIQKVVKDCLMDGELFSKVKGYES